jgi:hypothetical protein
MKKFLGRPVSRSEKSADPKQSSLREAEVLALHMDVILKTTLIFGIRDIESLFAIL